MNKPIIENIYVNSRRKTMKNISTWINMTYKIYENAVNNIDIKDINEIIWKVGYIHGRIEEQGNSKEKEKLKETTKKKFEEMSQFVSFMLMSEEEYNKKYKYDTAGPSQPTPKL